MLLNLAIFFLLFLASLRVNVINGRLLFERPPDLMAIFNFLGILTMYFMSAAPSRALRLLCVRWM